MNERSGRTVIITGAASGLGKALAQEFHRLGYNLALIDIDLAGLQSLQQHLKLNEQKITIHHCDISQEEKISSVRTDILNEHKRVDFLINNAGISISQTFDNIDLADFKNLIGTNFLGTVYGAKNFLPDLKKQRDSRLVNIISGFALMGFPGKTAYSASKSAVMGFTYSLKTELADTFVKVCLVVPPPLDTGIVKNSKHMSSHKKLREAEFLEKNGAPLDQVAKRIIRQIEKGKFRIVIGKMTFWADLASRLFPTWLHTLIGKNKNKIDFV